LHRTCATFFQRRVIEISIRTSVEDFLRQRRSFDHITGEKVLLISFDRFQQLDEAFNVHCFFQTVFHRLMDQGMLRNFSFTAAKIFKASNLIRKYRRQQVFSIHALQLRRNLLTATPSQNRK
jgi:hypothetical protein